MRANRRREIGADGSLLPMLASPVRLRDALLLFLMPLTASAVYGAAYAVDVGDTLIEITAGMAYILSAIVGGGGFVVAVWRLLRDGRRADASRADVEGGLLQEASSG